MTDLIERVKKKWQAKRKEKKIVITIYLNSSTIDPSVAAGDACCIRTGKEYKVRVACGVPRRAILAHEIGHCVQHLLGESWATTYALYRSTGAVDTDIIKCEASAWRFAVKMFPDLGKSLHVLCGFSHYLWAWVKPTYVQLDQRE